LLGVLMSEIDNEIANLIESGDSIASLPAAPHPAAGGGPQNFEGGGDDGFAGDDGADLGAIPDDADKIDGEVIARCAAQPQNDTGNGQRLLNHFGNALLHVREIGWHSWTGTHWRREGGEEIATRSAQITAARIALEADYLTATPSERIAIENGEQAADDLRALERIAQPNDEQKKQKAALGFVIEIGKAAAGELKKRQLARRKYAVSSGNASKIGGMISQALPHRTVPPEALDADPLQFNVENGTLRFTSREIDDPDGSEATGFKKTEWQVAIEPHNPADAIAKLAPVIYDAAAECPRFMAFLDRFQPNQAIRAFLQNYLGYAMTGSTGEQCLIFLHGLGANGKSTLIEIVCRILGDYALTLSFESLAGENGRRGDQASPDLARLPGARLVRASEPERGVHFKESLLKSLTGGEPMLVRHLHKGFFEFRPAFKLVLSGNHKPEIGGVDHGIWRRMRLVPWDVTISEVDRRPIEEVLAEFWDERAGILNWLIQGALIYLAEGLKVPPEIADATAEYREEMDPIEGFITACVTKIVSIGDDEVQWVPAREMYDAFVAWAEANAVRPWKEKSFASALVQKGFQRDRTKITRRYLNVKLHDVPKAARGNRDNEPPHPAAADDEVPV
jgi:putative DNA primase/helicase